MNKKDYNAEVERHLALAEQKAKQNGKSTWMFHDGKVEVHCTAEKVGGEIVTSVERVRWMQIEQYEKGMARKFVPIVDGNCFVAEHVQCTCGSYHSHEFENKVGLPHSCDEWIIGGRDDVLALIDDLKELI